MTNRTARSYELDFDLPFGDITRVVGAAAVVRTIVEGKRSRFTLKRVTLVETLDEILARLNGKTSA